MWKKLDAMCDTLLQAMKSDIVDTKQNKYNKISCTNWARIPNMKRFTVAVRRFNDFLLTYGLKKRLPPELIWEPYRNKKMNRYMERQVLRLRCAKRLNDGRLYWTIAMHCLQRSASFRVSAINQVMGQWHRNYPLSYVMQVNRKVQHMMADWDDKLIFKRVYIDKANGKLRPLGVPTMEWRIILHMWQNMIYIFMEEYLLNSQHGFVPRRGTLSAWRQLIEKLDKPYIYECDLTSFFDRVHVNRVSKILEDNGMPKRIMYHIENINRCTPTLPEEQPMDEGIVQAKADINEGKEDAIMKGLTDFIDANGLECLLEQMAQDGMSEPYEWAQAQWAAYDHFSGGHEGFFEAFVGLPQGAPTSPLLSILTLRKFLTQQDSLSYADDPIFFGDEDFEIKDMPEEGIEINQSKSGWVKREGKWLKPLKYLGLEYDGNKEIFRAKTREGATLEFAKEQFEELAKTLDLHYSDDRKKDASVGSWQEMLKYKIGGWIQNRMYNDSWDILELTKDVELVRNSLAWANRRTGAVLTLGNCSSYASFWLANVLRKDIINKKLKKYALR